MSASLFRAGGRTSQLPRPMQYRNCNYRFPIHEVPYWSYKRFLVFVPDSKRQSWRRQRAAAAKSASSRSEWEERRRRGRTGEATPSAVSSHARTTHLFQTNEQNEVALSVSKSLPEVAWMPRIGITQPRSRTNEVV